MEMAYSPTREDFTSLPLEAQNWCVEMLQCSVDHIVAGEASLETSESVDTGNFAAFQDGEREVHLALHTLEGVKFIFCNYQEPAAVPANPFVIMAG